MSGTDSQKPWSGRFSSATDELMERFNASIGFDRKLLEVDVAGSVVYARALHKAGVLEESEAERIIEGLHQVREEFGAAGCELGPELEDIHMAVENRLTQIIGPLGGKLHAGRSRNDLVSLDERLYLRQAVQGLRQRIRRLQAVLLQVAETHAAVVLPGYTHLQQAQPILFSHYALSLFWMLERDRGRLEDGWKRADFLPLGAGALAGSTFPLDREFMARELGFSRVSPNSLDAVSDRDFLLECLAALSILMMHLSRFCEDLIIWSSAEFGFVELADAFATGSSMMPQKKNPDSLELIRGKSGRVYGDLISLLTTMKGIPLTYAKDMQEDKEPFFDALETTQISLEVFTGVWETLELRQERMEQAIDGNTLATDLADYLVRQGMAFRDAHHVISNLVREAIATGKALTAMSLDELRKHSDRFGEDVVELLDVRHSLELRNIAGGTGPEAVRLQLQQARSLLDE
jgi:argininosuccinate lyase